MRVERRSSVLYVRVRPSLKKWVQKCAQINEVSESAFVDYLLEKEKHASKTPRVSKSS